MSKQKLFRGFTIIELVVIVAVIGVLSAITTVGVGKYMADTRDSRRVASVTVISEALEKYYGQHGEYPGCPDVTAEINEVANDVLSGVERTALVAPSAANEENSIKCSTLSLSGEDFYEYEGDGSGTCLSGESCLSYTLKYKEEASGEIKSIASRHNTSVVTSGSTTLSKGSETYTTVPLSWLPISNAVGYVVQRSNSCASFTGAQETEFTGTSGTITGLTMGSSYCFRVAGKAGNNQRTNYSNNISATTTTLAAPVLSIGSITSNSFTVSWPAVSGAQSYDLEQRTDTNFTGTPTVSGITGTSSNRTGLSTGVLYYFKGRARTVDNGTTVYSNWSATQSGTTQLPAPTGISTSSPSCGQATINWSAVTGASTYTINYSVNSNMSSPVTITGRTGTSHTFSVAGASQGGNIYITVAGVTSGGNTGLASTAAARAVAICPPAAYNLSCSNNGTTMTCTSQAVCVSGATGDYYWYVNGSAYQTGTNLQTNSYTPPYDYNLTFSANSRCTTAQGQSSWVGASNSGTMNRGVPGPPCAPWWGQHVVSNDLNMNWGLCWCSVGTTYTRVLIYRRSTGALTQNSGYMANATSWRRASLPVASWDSYVTQYCQGSTGASGEAWSAVGRAG